MKKRNLRYLLLTWFLFGGMLLYAAFFTCMNDFTKLSFSYTGNDICVVPNEILETARMDNGEYILEFPVNLSHYTINYLRMYIDGAKKDDVRMFFVGYDNEWQTVVEIPDYVLKDGVVDIELASQNFKNVGIAVYGSDSRIIQKMQFRESLEVKDPKKAFPFMIKILVIYLVLTVPLFFVMKFKKRGSQNVR